MEPKIVLLVRLLNAIDAGRYSFDELRNAIAQGERPPSPRTLRRYLAELSAAGFPWLFDRSTNTYKFSPGYSLKRLELSSSQLWGLVAVRAMGASLGGSIGAYVDEVAERIISSAPGSVRERMRSRGPMAFRVSGIGLDSQGERTFAMLNSAERDSRAVRFEYQDKEGRTSMRTVDPYGFVVSGGRLYCVAYDRRRADKRVFAVDSISGLTVLPTTFARPADFNIETFASTSISGVLHGGKPVRVRVRFARRVARAAQAARVVSSRHVESCADGSVEITYRVTDLDELVRWVLGWGSQAEIVAPKQARSRARKLALDIACKYE